jgi:hypothetical protein
LKFWDKEKIRKNCVSRKACPERRRRDAKAPRFGEIDNKSFFASLAAWRDNIFCHFSLENKMLDPNSQTSECKKLKSKIQIGVSVKLTGPTWRTARISRIESQSPISPCPRNWELFVISALSRCGLPYGRAVLSHQIRFGHYTQRPRGLWRQT